MVRVSPKKSFKKVFWTLAFGFSTIMLFQNCSDLNNADVISITDVEQQLLENLPFAFESTIDQMGYMSCSGQAATSDPKIFTLKAGAFSSGSGIRLKSNYLSQISHLSAETQHKSLALSSRNIETGAVLSIRERNNLQVYLAFNQNGEKSIDRLMFNESLGRTFSMEHYAKRFIALGSGNYMNYIPGLTGFLGKTFDGEVRLSANGAVEELIRSFLGSSHYLTVTYNEAVGNQTGMPFQLVRSPHNTLNPSGNGNARTSVFGLGYALSFSQFDARMYDVPNRVMSVEHAVNLENNSVMGEDWDCSEKFVIVRPEDALRNTVDPDPSVAGSRSETGLQVCPKKSDDQPLNVQQQRRWERIRNILPVENWYVNLPRDLVNSSGNPVIDPATGQPYRLPGCVVPKGNDSCYDMNELTGGTNNQNIRVAYYREEIGGGEIGSGWNHTVDGIVYNGRCGPGTTFVCPHFVTICYKK